MSHNSSKHYNSWNKFIEEAKEEKPLAVIKENTSHKIAFNIMPNNIIQEELIIKNYKIWDNSIEVNFDHKISNQEKNNLSYLTLLSIQIQIQKLIYIYMCYKLGFKYDPSAPEVLKIWPTRVDCKVSRMIRNNKSLRQVLYFERLEKTGDGVYFSSGTSIVNNAMVIYGEVNVYVLGKN